MTSNKSKLLITKVNHKVSLDKPSFEDCEYDGEPKEGFIRAVNVKNITIDGDGVIDGSEEIFMVSKLNILLTVLITQEFLYFILKNVKILKF